MNIHDKGGKKRGSSLTLCWEGESIEREHELRNNQINELIL